MTNDSSGTERYTPPFVRPVLHALDRMQARKTLSPDEIVAQARTLLDRRFGSDGEAAIGFAHGSTGLLGEQTHYSDGFAFLLSLEQGIAVALRPTAAAETELVFEGGEDRWSFAPGEPAPLEAPPWVCIVQDVLRRREVSRPLHIAVTSTVPASCFDAYMSALSVASVRAVQALPHGNAPSGDLEAPALRNVLADCTELPFSVAYPVAAAAGHPEAFRLVDTTTLEHLPVEAPSRDVLGWGIVDVGGGAARDPAFHRERKQMADEALAILREKGFPELPSFRELEHRDLRRATEALPERLQPIARHLVTENRRVQKIVAAVRKKDWQLFGALLLMSHASLRDSWQSTTLQLDFVVEQAEAMSLEGMHGACMTGRGGCVLVAGRPFTVPEYLDRMAAAFEEQFGTSPETMLL